MQCADYIFIITSTINTPLGLISNDTRFSQTLETIISIKSHVKNSIILLIDNSTQPLNQLQEKIISDNVDHFLYVGDRKQVIDINRNGIKGAGESYMLLTAFDFIKTNAITGDRVFKISGRYKLSDNFDIAIYDQDYIRNKYVFKIRDYHNNDGIYKPVNDDWFLHTRMWSFSYSLLDDTITMIRKSWHQLMTDNITIEQSIYRNINLDNLVELDIIGSEGFIAPWNTLIKD